MRSNLITVAVYLGLCFLLFSCVVNEEKEFEEHNDQTQAVIKTNFVTEIEDSVLESRFVCDPFSNSGNQDQLSFNGIAGQIYDGLSHPYRDVHDYFEHGSKVSSPVFLSDINVPTRRFNTGFNISENEYVLNTSGEKLYEYFALDLRGRIKLADGDTPGNYQFAVLSDDGSIFEIEEEGQMQALIDNNRYTPTRMKCADKTIRMDNQTKLTYRLKYFQGPRMHISLMLLWRKVTEEHSDAEPLCDHSGNSLFFNSGKIPSEPQAAFLELKDRGWRVLGEDNYLLPLGLIENPCGGEKKRECITEKVVIEEGNWFYFDAIGVDMQSIKIHNSENESVDFYYEETLGRVRIETRENICQETESFKIKYCVEKD